MLKRLCSLSGVSGAEDAVRDFIIAQIKDDCSYHVDALGSIIAFKKGKQTPAKSVCFHAHMDEVGFIITGVTEEGYLRFSAVGGIDASVCLDRMVCVGNNGVKGVIADKAYHLLEAEEKNKIPSFNNLLIDIGATSAEEALAAVSPGDYACFESTYETFGNGFIKSKALDDRIGCLLMIELIKKNLEYDTYFCFNVQEEVGLRGAMCTAYAVQSDIAVILETTTAGDLDGVSGADKVCALGEGVVISFMDKHTIYDKALYQLAMETGRAHDIPVQTKTAIAGGNDAGAVQTGGKGARVLALSVPSRYLHSGATVVKEADIEAMRRLLPVLMEKLYD